MQRIAIITFALIILITGCAGTRSSNLVGNWYGEKIENSTVTKWVNERKEDGTYRILFKQYKEGKLVAQQTESGEWRYKDGIYSTRTRMIGTEKLESNDPYYNDDYKVELLTSQEMVYVHIRHGIKYKAVRVSKDFEF